MDRAMKVVRFRNCNHLEEPAVAGPTVHYASRFAADCLDPDRSSRRERGKEHLVDVVARDIAFAMLSFNVGEVVIVPFGSRDLHGHQQ